jgi:hypothetical protein
MSLQSEIVEFFRGEKRPLKRQELIALIVREAAINRAWTSASYEQWDRALAGAVRAGELVLDGEVIRAKVLTPKVNSQMELF